MTSQNSLPVRKTLSHSPPVSVSHVAADAVYFITICVDRSKYGISGQDIGRKGPLTRNVAVSILCALQHYVSTLKLSLLRAVVMPDHLHLVLRANENVAFGKVITSFKTWMARRHGIEWQRGFFDHRLRSDESYHEKSEYVAMNPVRKGLCRDIFEWPYSMRWE